MKLILTTVYNGMDEEWLEWYLNQLEQTGMPEQIRSAHALRKGESYSFTSSDPTDKKCSATTTYRLEK